MIEDQRIGYLIKRVQQSLRSALDGALQLLPLTTAQYAALSALERGETLSNAELARACFVTPQTMIEISQAMEATGLVKRQRHPYHGRIVQLTLTDEGRQMVAQAHDIAATIEERMLAGLGHAQRAMLAEWLNACAANLDVER